MDTPTPSPQPGPPAAATDRTPTLFRSVAFTNRFLWEVLPDRSWAGHPAVLVGGGPSLAGFNWDRLRGYRTIGVNRAYEFFCPTIHFSMDTRFLNWVLGGQYGEAALGRFNALPMYRVWLLTYTASLRDDIFIVPAWKGSYPLARTAMPSSMLDGLGHGNNSGYGALNLAIALGADPIYLLGYDGQHVDGKTHFHSGHLVPQSVDQVRSFPGFFDLACPAIKRLGVRVINLNPSSAVRCFDFSTPEEAL